MFCPQCGTQNEPKQSYCRQCGQPLTTVLLALEGQVDEALARFKKGRDSLVDGIAMFGIFFLIGVVAFLIGGFWPFAIDIILGLIISLPFMLRGVVRLQRADRSLNAQEKSGGPVLQSGRPAASLPAVHTADSLDSSMRIPSSVTERTTLDLKPPEPRR